VSWKRRRSRLTHGKSVLKAEKDAEEDGQRRVGGVEGRLDALEASLGNEGES